MAAGITHAHLNTIHDKYNDWMEAVQASPVHRPIAPRPMLKARNQEKGRPSPQYMRRLMVAPICRRVCNKGNDPFVGQ
jgi:hypothetical protein